MDEMVRVPTFMSDVSPGNVNWSYEIASNDQILRNLRSTREYNLRSHYIN